MMVAAPAGRALLAAGVLAVAGCAGNGSQSALDTAGSHADRIASLWWVFLWVCAAVYVVVIAALLYGVWRRSGRGEAVVVDPDPASEATRRTVVSTAVGLTIVVVVALTAASYLTDRALATDGADDPSAVRIKLTGHQWWWQVVYDDPVAARQVTTANEIHIPVGRAAIIQLQSSDVIHSFWVPNLNGKQDLIPGRNTNTIRVRPERIGTFRGQCAEFCGAQHANMAMLVHVDSADDFDKWRDGQLASAAEPADDESRRGRDVFLSSSCVLCHTVRGIGAGGRAGPDLTHVASRETLAAATIPNTTGHLAAWIADPQRIKEGVHMPSNGLDPEDLQALLAYLRTLE
ncbi:MAG: cytochrome c oxidase subunit II [Gemmatimonas sp.]